MNTSPAYAANAMHDDENDLYAELLAMYGPMMELGDLANVLRRNRNGIRNALTQAEEAMEAGTAHWALPLARCKVRIGKKTLFRTRVIADLLTTEAMA